MSGPHARSWPCLHLLADGRLHHRPNTLRKRRNVGMGMQRTYPWQHQRPVERQRGGEGPVGLTQLCVCCCHVVPHHALGVVQGRGVAVEGDGVEAGGSLRWQPGTNDIDVFAKC